MIYAICGTPGSFKSCYAVENFLLPALKSNRKVYTNIEGLNPLYIATYYDLDPIVIDQNLSILGRVYDDDGTFHEDRNLIRKFYEDLPQNALVIIDEAQNYFSSRDFKEGFSADLIPWLTKHRHLGNDVVWITQNVESVDITFRRNTHLTYAMRRAENIGLKNSAFAYIFDRADLERKHLSKKLYRPDKTIFKLYSSYQNSEVEEKRKSYNVFLRSPFVWFSIIVIGIAIYTIFSGKFSEKVIHTKKKKTEVVEQVKSEPKQEIQPEEIKQNDNLCYTKKIKVHGETIVYLSDGSRSSASSNFHPCR